MRKLVLLLFVAAALPACKSSQSPSDGGPADASPTDDGGSTSSACIAPSFDGGVASAACGAPLTKGPWTLGATDTGATIYWETKTQGCVKLGLRPEATPEAAETEYEGTAVAGEVKTGYGVGQVVYPDYPGTWYVNHVTLTNLQPGTCYLYTLHDQPAEAGKTCVRQGRFCTARPSGKAFRFLAIGDTNPALDHTTQLFPYTIDADPKPDFVLHTGDIQYYASSETWALWFQRMQPMMSSGAFFPCVGNHESETNYGEPTEFADYYDRLFHQPAPIVDNGGGDDAARWYRYQWGGVWFHSISTEDLEGLAVGGAQYQWLKSSLEYAKSQPGFRFSVVYMHRPMYTLGDSDTHPELRESLGPLFVADKVALVLNGHMHGYEHFKVPVDTTKPDGPFITYITTAGGGGYISSVDNNKASRPDIAPYRIASSPAYHIALFDVTPHDDGSTSVHVRAVGCSRDECRKPTDYDGVIDEFMLTVQP